MCAGCPTAYPLISWKYMPEPERTAKPQYGRQGCICFGKPFRDALRKSGSASIRLFGAIPIKTIEYGERQDITVMPGGMPIGVSIYTDGALVVGLGSISETAQICPAASAGIRAGDVITAVNGETVRDSLHLSELCSKGGELTVTVRRDGQQLTVALTPVKDPETTHTGQVCG